MLAAVGDRLFAIERPGGASREVAIGAGGALDPRLSPDGARVAFVRGGDLWAMAVGDPRPTRLTQHPAEQEYGTAELVARELGRTRGHWWSPDGQAIAFQRTDHRGVEKLSLGDPRYPERPAAAVPYPRAGKALPAIDLGVVSARGGAPRWISWDRARYPHLARVVWPARGPLTLIVLDRAQTEVAVLAADPAAGTTRPLLVEKDAAWIDLQTDRLTWLEDGSGFLWLNDTRDAMSLEHHAADGKHVRQVTDPSFGARRVAGFSADGREAIVEAVVEPGEQHVWRVPLAGGAPTALTSGGGIHRALAAHGVIAVRSQLRAGGTRASVLRPGGSRIELPSVAERPAPPTTELTTVNVDVHVQRCAITRPRKLDPRVRYPVLLLLDTGPHAEAVLDPRDTYLMDQWYADAGFVVVRTDGRGTPGHGRAWSRAVSGDLITRPVHDQIAALKILGARYPQLEIARTGVLGEGFGGHLATTALLMHPDVFAAGAATSPIADWEMFDAVFAERYLRAPSANAEGYRRSSALTYADRLSRPLLLIHDRTDPRIHFAHTLALLDAFGAAGRHASVAALSPGADPARAIALHRMRLEHFREHLGPPQRPKVMPPPRSEEWVREREEELARERAGGKDPGRTDPGRKDREEPAEREREQRR